MVYLKRVKNKAYLASRELSLLASQSSLQPMSPFLQSKFDGQQFSISNITGLLHWGGMEGGGMAAHWTAGRVRPLLLWWKHPLQL